MSYRKGEIRKFFKKNTRRMVGSLCTIEMAGITPDTPIIVENEPELKHVTNRIRVNNITVSRRVEGGGCHDD